MLTVRRHRSTSIASGGRHSATRPDEEFAMAACVPYLRCILCISLLTFQCSEFSLMAVQHAFRSSD